MYGLYCVEVTSFYADFPIQPVCGFWLELLIHLHYCNYLYICSYAHILNCFGFVFVGLFLSLVFTGYVSPLSICCKAGLVVLNSLNFCLSVKL